MANWKIRCQLPLVSHTDKHAKRVTFPSRLYVVVGVRRTSPSLCSLPHGHGPAFSAEFQINMMYNMPTSV